MKNSKIVKMKLPQRYNLTRKSKRNAREMEDYITKKKKEEELTFTRRNNRNS